MNDLANFSEENPSASLGDGGQGVGKPTRPNFHFHHSAFGPDVIRLGRTRDDQYMRFHSDLCRALDMTKMSIVLSQMVEAGCLDKRMAELFHMQAGTLLALLTSENNRAFSAKDAPQ